MNIPFRSPAVPANDSASPVLVRDLVKAYLRDRAGPRRASSAPPT
jgi:hypothetical protein